MSASLVLQARVGSSRFPGKALADIGGRTLQERVMLRLEAIHAGTRVLAIPDTRADDPLEEIGRRRGWKVFRGSESDVLGRFAGAVRTFDLERVIRATADNPLVDAAAVSGVAAALESHACVGTRGFAHGTAVEGASGAALLSAAEDATDPYEREHVMPHLYRHPEKYRGCFVDAPADAPTAYSFTVDTAEDVERTRAVFTALGDMPNLAEVARFLADRARAESSTRGEAPRAAAADPAGAR